MRHDLTCVRRLAGYLKGLLQCLQCWYMQGLSPLCSLICTCSLSEYLCFPTLLTSAGALPRVCPHVGLQVLSMPVGPPTLLTFIGPLDSVRPNMPRGSQNAGRSSHTADICKAAQKCVASNGLTGLRDTWRLFTTPYIHRDTHQSVSSHMRLKEAFPHSSCS